MTTVEALELASTIQLYDELITRFDTLVFVGVQTRPIDGHPDNENRMRRFKGNSHTCIGLCADLAFRLSRNIQDQETQLPEEEL